MTTTSLIQQLDEIRKLVIISLFYDDEFLTRFVLKGGNALNIVYNVNNRASMDVDVSMENDFSPDELADIESRLLTAFNQVFNENGYHVFDFKLQPKPKNIESEYEKFWGGYKVELKIIETEKFEQFEQDLQNMRRHAAVVGVGQEKKLTVDISKYEYVAPKQLVPLPDADYSVYVYTPIMVIYEKLRAICQQMEEYKDIVPTNSKARARDFFDIYTIVEKWKSPVNVYDPGSLHIVEESFAAKKVPISFLLKIRDYREYHRDNFNTVAATVTSIDRLESYDYYFDYVVEMAERLWSRLNGPDLQSAEIAATAE